MCTEATKQTMCPEPEHGHNSQHTLTQEYEAKTDLMST